MLSTSQPCERLPKLTTAGAMIVMMVGEEGTGHHALCASLPRCGAGRRYDLAGSAPCFSHDAILEDSVRKLMAAITHSALDTARDRMELRMRHLAAGGGDATRWIFQCAQNATGGGGWKASYPDAEFAHRQRLPLDAAYPDIVALAALAERSQVDFRVVRLMRDPIETVRSRQRNPANKDHKAPLGHHARLVRLMDVVVGEQLRCIDPNFVTLLNYSRAATAPEAERLARFLRVDAAQMTSSLRAYWRTSNRSAALDEEDAAFVRDIWHHSVRDEVAPSRHPRSIEDR